MTIDQQARWWQGAVLYQVYVRSWRDSNGDGYGDLTGVVEGLDYLDWLGVDGIWLSPTMPSPDDDWGYDVSDYMGVHPDLGTPADLDRLIDQAGARGIKVLLDLVPNHTSSAHPWFVEAVSAPESESREFYVWSDPSPTGAPPNNWVDATGRSAWTLDERSGQFYLHNFLPSQPDLNWWNPQVAVAFEDILSHWFDRGVAGFRIDVAHGLYKDSELRDNPVDPRGDMNDGHYGQLQLYNKNRPEVHQVYESWRRIADSYDPPAVLLGETWVLDVGDLVRFFGNDDQLQLAFNFPFVFSAFTAPAMSSVVGSTIDLLPDAACPTWVGSNHDISRFPTRWCGGDERKIRLALVVLCTLPGTAVIYYGDEIGMVDVDVPASRQRDPMSGGDTGRPLRDRSRTPMQWSGDHGGGFGTPDVTPWLPYGDFARCNVADQRDDPTSVLSLCRALLALRRAEHGARVPPYELMSATDKLWLYRVGELVVAANMSDEAVSISAPFDLQGHSLHEHSLQGHSVVIDTGSRAGAREQSAVPDGQTGPEHLAPSPMPGSLEAWQAVVVKPPAPSR